VSLQHRNYSERSTELCCDGTSKVLQNIYRLVVLSKHGKDGALADKATPHPSYCTLSTLSKWHIGHQQSRTIQKPKHHGVHPRKLLSEQIYS
jgi:hypothetical protein